MSDVREDNYNSFKLVESQVEEAFKKGELTGEAAKDILQGAKVSYQNGDGERFLENRK